MEFLSKVICMILIFLLTWNGAWGTDCDRLLAGHEGVVFSYNFPLDYEKGISCIYRHNFLEMSEVTSICLQFKRFNLSQSDYLLINGEKYTNRGEMTLANLCVPYTGAAFEMEFHSDDTPTNFGYPGFYATYYVTTRISSTTSNPLNESTTEANPREENVFCNSPDLFQCFDGKKCIDIALQCNQEFDCEDKSDEAYATARCEGVEGQRSYFQAINISSLPLDLSKYRMKITKGNWIAESKSDDTDFGPDGPHVSGYYLRTDFSNASTAELELELEDRDPVGWHCLTFWYNIYGQGSGQLNVRWSTNVAWTRLGNTGQRWHKAQVIKPAYRWHNKIIFEANRWEEGRSQIAIQDISVMPGLCLSNSDYYAVADDISCTFEEDNCLWSFVGGWSSTNYTDFSLGPPGAAQGEYYMQQYYINPLYLGSPLVTSPETACFTFKAYAREDAEIDTKIVNGNAVSVQSFPVAGSAGWQQFKMNIFVNPLEYNITLTSKSLGIFYDDFVFLNAQCDDLDLYGCDETEYMCTGSLECISRSTAFCNAVRDCPNGDDELTCTSCNEGAFLCGTKKCVPPESRCDGIPQCNDYSDEENCNGLNGGQIAGIVIGCLAAVALIVVLGVLVYSRSKKGRFV